jgi:hypothetical protein
MDMRKIDWVISIVLALSLVQLAGAQFGKTSGPKFYFAIVSACLGTLSSLNGFFLIFRIPFFH